MAPDTATYERFARYYDFIYEGLLDYAADVRYLEEIFRTFLPRRPRTVLDVGCGTGGHALRLAHRGYAVTGLDLSRPQLAIARRKAKEARLAVRFVAADMRSFRLRSEFDAAICMFGAFGYVLRTIDVLTSLRTIRRHLVPGGIFAFEFWQSSAARPAPHLSWVHRKSPEFELVRLDAARFDPRTRILPIDFHFFVFKGRRVLDRFDETHTVRTYHVPEMRGLLERGGFEVAGMFGVGSKLKKGFTRPRKDTFRVFAIARRKG